MVPRRAAPSSRASGAASRPFRTASRSGSIERRSAARPAILATEADCRVTAMTNESGSANANARNSSFGRSACWNDASVVSRAAVGCRVRSNTSRGHRRERFLGDERSWPAAAVVPLDSSGWNSCRCSFAISCSWARRAAGFATDATGRARSSSSRARPRACSTISNSRAASGPRMPSRRIRASRMSFAPLMIRPWTHGLLALLSSPSSRSLPSSSRLAAASKCRSARSHLCEFRQKPRQRHPLLHSPRDDDPLVEQAGCVRESALFSQQPTALERHLSGDPVRARPSRGVPSHPPANVALRQGISESMREQPA